jgi:nucleoside-diphosphate-sugar epimerase
MRIFVAGATGALGRRLVPKLIAAGHEVVGMTRDGQGEALLREFGARAAIADALDAEAVRRAVVVSEPDAVVHQLTALSGSLDLRRFDASFAATNRLRTEGTDNLLAAARAAGATRFIAQSFAGWPFERSGGPVKTEYDLLDSDPPAPMRRTLEAIRYLEQVVTGARDLVGIVLRYGGFYGPGTSIALDPPADQVVALRKRKIPLVGGGTGVWSFVHVDDAAAATVAALHRGHAGVYHVVDDEPAPVRDWLPALAEAVGAPPPFRLPRWLGRIAAGQAVIVLMTESRGASNEKAKRELGWQPEHASWRTGFVHGLALR